MPNGTTGAVRILTAQLQDWVSVLPADTIVASVAGPVVEPVSAAALLAMLPQLNRPQVPSWVYEDAKYCELLLLPYRVRIARESLLYGRLPRSTRRGYADIAVDELTSELRRLEPDATIGSINTKRIASFPVSAGDLRLRLDTHSVDVSILEQDHGTYYVLWFSGDEPQGMVVDAGSPLLPLIRQQHELTIKTKRIPQERTRLYLAETAGDVYFVVFAGIAIVVATGRYVSWWLAVIVAVLWSYGLMWRARVRRATRKR